MKKKFNTTERTEKSKSKGVSFVVIYHRSLNCFHRMIRDNTDLLKLNEEKKNVFFPGPMVSFRSVDKLSSYIVLAKSYSLHRKIGSKKYAKTQCEVYDYVRDTCTFTSPMAGESLKFNHRRCIIYSLICKQCQKQYSGKTTDYFRYR